MSKELRLQVVLSAIDRLSGPFEKAKTANTRLAKQLKSTRERLTQLNQASQKLTQLQTLSGKINTLGHALEKARLKGKMMGLEMAGLQNPTQKQTAALEKQWASVAKLERQYQGFLTQHQKIRSSVDKMGISVNHADQATTHIRQETQKYTQALKSQEGQLAKISAREKHLTTARNRYQQRMNRRNTLLSHGAGMVATGTATAMAVKPTLNEAAIYQKEALSLKSTGIGDTKLNEAKKHAENLHVFGNSQTENLTTLKEAYVVTQDYPESIRVTPDLLKFQTVMKYMATHGVGSTNASDMSAMNYSALKIAEMRNAINSEAEFRHSLNMSWKAIAASGALLSPQDYLAMLKIGGTPAKQLSDEAFYFSVSHSIQELGGERVGNSLNSAFQGLIQGRTTQRAMEYMNELGLLKKDALVYGKTGHITKMKEGALVNQALYLSDPYRYLMTEMVPRIQKKYPKATEQEMQMHIAQIFSNRTAADIFVTFYRDRVNIEKQIKAARKALDINKIFSEIQPTAQGQQIELEAKKADLYREMGDNLLPLYTQGLEMLNQQLTKLTDFFKSHPTMTRYFGVALGGFAALITIGGVMALTMAALTGPLATVKLGLSLLSTGLIRLTTVALANPIVLGITAIAVAALLIYRYWDNIAPFFKNLWEKTYQFFADGYQKIKTSIKNFGSELIDNLKNGVMEKWQQLKTLFADIKNTVTDLLPDWMVSEETKTLRANQSLTVLNASIKGAGLFDKGGVIRRGSAGIVGEQGPEIVTGPAHVFSRRHTAAFAAAALTLSNAYANQPIHPFVVDKTDAAVIRTPHTSAPSTIHITINAAPAQSAHDIAQKVRRQLLKLQRQQQAQLRGRFSDNPEEY
ncbi:MULTISPECIES: hypothetical protein [unclassified Arsenophonus]|uniref:phage tail tape measure protein n=1 Tax=unclassified Arsenophonus TaxID=2627083 RepID=UPI002854664A|nr:hypothetical protein [Arsenophonus sp.]MDR5610990.1 hypothetical protein [Arsenophonus sp.]MDR5614945.1 hypothetical protein [Arsenophonus sp.]